MTLTPSVTRLASRYLNAFGLNTTPNVLLSDRSFAFFAIFCRKLSYPPGATSSPCQTHARLPPPQNPSTKTAHVFSRNQTKGRESTRKHPQPRETTFRSAPKSQKPGVYTGGAPDQSRAPGRKATMNLQHPTDRNASTVQNASIPIFTFLMGNQGQPEESSGKEGKTRETPPQPKEKAPKPMLYLDREIEWSACVRKANGEKCVNIFSPHFCRSTPTTTRLNPPTAATFSSRSD